MRLKKLKGGAGKPSGSVCAWCGKRIREGQEVFGFGVKVNPARLKELKEFEGRIAPMKLTVVNKTVPAIVASETSEAKRQGHDLVFMICTEACGLALKAALVQEELLGQRLLPPVSLPREMRGQKGAD